MEMEEFKICQRRPIKTDCWIGKRNKLEISAKKMRLRE
jgi:hypothetical protein